MNCTDFVRRPDPELIQLVSTLERRWGLRELLGAVVANRPACDLTWLMDCIESKWGLREMCNAAAEVLVCRSECTLSDDWQAAIRALIQAANLEPYDKARGGAK